MSGLSSFSVLTGEQLLSATLPPRELLLAPWLPAKGLAMIYGPRGIGKTHVTLGIARALATGTSFLGWRAPKPRRVLIIDGEMPASALQERLRSIVVRAGNNTTDTGNIVFLAADLQERSGVNLANYSDQIELEAHLEGIDLIIVDNISTCVTLGRENEAESWLPVQEWGLAQRRAGRSVLFVHHAGKDGNQRGTSRREDVLDTVIGLRKPKFSSPTEGARFEVHFEKSRGFHGDDAKPFLASLKDDGWKVEPIAGPPVPDLARALALRAQGHSIREVAEILGVSRSSAHRMLQEIVGTDDPTPQTQH
jgi:putative DNA primase/helicase